MKRIAFPAFVFLLFVASLARAQVTMVGPVYPPPGGATLSATGSSANGNISRPGGNTFTITNVALACWKLPRRESVFPMMKRAADSSLL